ncbi:MAG: PAS domain S-box protein [bacterium]|nr:PAS domain S-box protein [bacterium]
MPLIAVPTCGLRAGVAWSLLTGLGTLGASVFVLKGFEPPFHIEAHLVPHESFWVGTGLLLAGLALATWYEVVRTNATAEIRDARAEKEVAQFELEESETRYRALLEHSFEGAAIVDAEGFMTYVRPTAEGQLLGYRRQDFPGQTIVEMAEAIVHPDDFPRLASVAQDVIEVPGKFAMEVVKIRHKDGSWRTIEAAAHNLTREPAVQGVVLNYRDLTDAEERRHRDLRSRAGLPDASHLESLRVFAGGIAHEFGNMLTTIVGGAQQLADDLDSRSPGQRSLRDIEDAGWRLASVLEDIRIYAGAVSPSIGATDLGRIVAGVVEGRAETGSRGLEIVLQRPMRLFPVRVDTALVERAVSALVENAVEASQGQGIVSVRVGATVLGAEDLVACIEPGKGLSPGRFAFVSVADDGGGLRSKDVAKIFHPYFSTHFAGRGLGLATVLGIARSNGGMVRVESEPQEGTTMTLLFPAVPQG